MLEAAAARSDDPASLIGAYQRRLGRQRLDYRHCPYALQAVTDGRGLVINDWDNRGPSPWAVGLELSPPYVILPVWDDDQLCAIIGADFADLPGQTEKLQPTRRAGAEALEWLRDGYGPEVRRALSSPNGSDVEARRLRVVERARVGVGTARSREDATRELLSALDKLLPDCRISVRKLTDNALTEHSDLCVRTRRRAPTYLTLDDSRSLAAKAVRNGLAHYIAGFRSYRADAKARGAAWGYSDEDVESVAHIPLCFEAQPLGSLSIDSLTRVDWREEGYQRPLLELAEITTLVLRDAIIFERLEVLGADRAALAASAAGFTGDAVWRHWAVQRLAEMSSTIATVSRTFRDPAMQASTQERLQRLDEVIGEVAAGGPPRRMERRSDLGKVLGRLETRWGAGPVRVVFHTDNGLPAVAIPTFYLLHALNVLIENAVSAIRNSGVGSQVSVSFSAEGPFVHIEVRDDGPGIPEGLRARVLREAVPSGTGSGVGLLLARGVALQFGGDLTQAPTDTGACFVVRLPAAG